MTDNDPTRAKIIPLPVADPAQQREAVARANLVDLLEAMLARAKAGQLTWIAAAFDAPDAPDGGDGLATVFQGITNAKRARDAIAGLRLVEHMIVPTIPGPGVHR